MLFVFFMLAVLLALSLMLSVLKTGRFAVWARVVRILVVAAALIFFTALFINKSVSQFREDVLTLQLINKLPQPLDFYIIKVSNETDAATPFESRHIGNIRRNHYRLEYEDMKNSDEFWIAGTAGKSDVLYFSQHAVPNKNEDQIIEVRNYINQSVKLSKIASAQITGLKLENMRAAVWITLDMLLLFLNFVLLLRRKKTNPA